MTGRCILAVVQLAQEGRGDIRHHQVAARGLGESQFALLGILLEDGMDLLHGDLIAEPVFGFAGDGGRYGEAIAPAQGVVDDGANLVNVWHGRLR